jgi:gamma-glutamylaminecyclotransferase
MAEAVAKVFAIGTLKKGFSFHDRGLRGARLLGRFRSIRAYPLVIAGPWFAPMLLDEPGVGLPVEGELYEVDEAGLERLDALESVGKPGNFRREIEVADVEDGTKQIAFAFMKDRMLAAPMHSDYIADYQDRRFIPPERRVQ